MKQMTSKKTGANQKMNSDNSTDAIRENTATCLEPCAIERGMRLIGGKWKGSILWHLKDGALRFNQLCRQMEGASRKMTVQRLKEMENLGLVQRTVTSERPISVSYSITPLGRSALGVLELLKEWTEHYEKTQRLNRDSNPEQQPFPKQRGSSLEDH